MAVLVTLTGSTPATAAGPERSTLARADTFVREQMRRTDVPGLAYSVIEGDDVVHARTWGEDGRGEPVTTRTPFLLGSLAKPVTALAVMQQVEAGKVALDAPVRRYLPWFRPKAEGERLVTVRQLLNHSSGLSERTGITRSDRFDNDPGGVTRLARELAGVRLSAAPGERHEYSNANYMLLGALVEAVSGRPFGEQLRKEILSPLGMTGALTDEREAQRARLAPGHRFVFGQPQEFASDFDTSGVPYGYLGANLQDLSAFAAAQLEGGGQGVLSPDGFRQMHKGTVAVHDRHRYGLGWRDDAIEPSGERMVWHAGATPGYHGIVVLLPERDLAVVVQHNAFALTKDAQLNNTGLGVARILLGAEPQPVDEDPWLLWTLIALGIVATVLTLAVGWSVVRVVRPRGRGQRQTVWIILRGATAVLGCLAIAAAACFVLPEQMGATLGVALLFTPDAAWLMIAVTALASILAVLRAAVTTRLLRTTRSMPATTRRHHPSAGPPHPAGTPERRRPDHRPRLRDAPPRIHSQPPPE